MSAQQPSRISAAIFAAKALALRGLRVAADLKTPLRLLETGNPADYPVLLAESRTPLWTEESAVENWLQLGKIQNLRKATGRLHRIEVPAGQVFSFWKQIGRARESAGYVKGRELRQGCLIPSIGGGLCQLSNAIYDLALNCGCEIVERHAHTQVVPGSAAEQGRDATVFWNYVDLRFRPQQDILITTALSAHELVLRFWGKQKLVHIIQQVSWPRVSSTINTCTDCGVEKCFRHVQPKPAGALGRAAFLIEECWPEFEAFANQNKSKADELFLPLSSNSRWGQRYRWDASGYSRTVYGTTPTLLNSVRSRLGFNGHRPPIAVQVEHSQRLASYYASRLSLDVSYMYVAQSLLPFLWRAADLGGRRFAVLMTRLPLHLLHRKLDELAVTFPERKTFQEFRAPQWMVEAEAEALEQAECLVAPHTAIARLFPAKIQKLEWMLPRVPSTRPGSCIAFCGPSLARKGAYELREALRGSDRKLLLLKEGALETERFWEGFNVVTSAGDWLEQAAVVVQPAFVENAPRPLLRALAAGIPVIATPECGIESHLHLTLVAAGDALALKAALEAACKPKTAAAVS